MKLGKGIIFALIVSFAFLISSSVALAATEKGEKMEAEALVKKTVAYLKVNGKDKTLTEINKQGGQFDKGELYVFAYDMTATVVAHPKNPKLIGKNLLNIPDNSGVYFRKEIVETAKGKGSGWVDYKYTNPQTRKLEAKTTFLQKSGDLILCCGVYK